MEPEITSDSLVVVERRRGRPRGASSGSRVSTWLPEEHHDRLVQLARQKRMSVSKYVCRLIINRLPR